ncbi:hypothetical protein GW17_00057333 [Ensete ventricosum]|nr:hypothetical protein GW17_00057333 [Ensete ventricosum]
MAQWPSTSIVDEHQGKGQANHSQALYKGNWLRPGPLQGWPHVAKVACKGGRLWPARKGRRSPTTNLQGATLARGQATGAAPPAHEVSPIVSAAADGAQLLPA